MNAYLLTALIFLLFNHTVARSSTNERNVEVLWQLITTGKGAHILVQDLQTRNTSTTATCGDLTKAVPIERTWNPDWTDFVYLFRAQAIAQIAVGNRLELQGTAALVFRTQELGTVGMYLGYSASLLDHMFLPSPTGAVPTFPSGYQNLGIQFYVYPDADCGGIPFYISYRAAATSHFYTTDDTERSAMVGAGYVNTGIAGYVLPPPEACGCDI